MFAFLLKPFWLFSVSDEAKWHKTRSDFQITAHCDVRAEIYVCKVHLEPVNAGTGLHTAPSLDADGGGSQEAVRPRPLRESPQSSLKQARSPPAATNHSNNRHLLDHHNVSAVPFHRGGGSLAELWSEFGRDEKSHKEGRPPPG